MKKSMFRVPEIFGIFVAQRFLWGFWRGFCCSFGWEFLAVLYINLCTEFLEISFFVYIYNILRIYIIL